MIILRKILFYLFLAAYLALCPLIILYSLGYIYAPKAEERIVKTGLIRLETLPTGASVYLNNKRFFGKTPCTISELLPNRYSVRIKLDGYQPWVRSIAVEAGKAAVFEKILLLPEKFRTKILVPQSFRELVRVPATRYLLLFGSKKIGDTFIFDWKDGVFRQLLATNAPFRQEEITRYFVSKGSPFVLFETRSEKNRHYLWCNLQEEDAEVRDISGFFRQREPDSVQWENGNPKYLFASYQNKLFRADLGIVRSSPDLLQGLRGFGLYKGKVYALQGSSLVRLNFDSKKEDAVTVDRGRFLADIFRDKGTFRLDFLSGDTVFFIGQDGELIANLLPYRFIEKGLAGYAPSEDFRKFLVWTREELGLFDLGRKERSGALFQRGPEIDWFSGKKTGIKQAFFVYGDSNALFCDEDVVRLTEIGVSSPETRDLVTVRKGSVPFYSEKNGKLYYLEPRAGNLVSLEVIPEENILERMLGESEKQEERAEQ